VDGSEGSKGRLRRESAAIRHDLSGRRVRGLPEAWGVSQARQFAKLCQRTGLPGELRNIEAAAELAGKLLDPAIRGEADGKRWNPKVHEWK
jgi:hypothetical protein